LKKLRYFRRSVAEQITGLRHGTARAKTPDISREIVRKGADYMNRALSVNGY
jgi:hypothetical protein